MPKITIDELARMMKEGFDHLAERLDTIDTRLGSVERLLTSNRIDRIEDDVRTLKTKAGLR